MQPSANSLVFDVTLSGRSLMNNKKRSGPSTVPRGTPLMTEAFSDVATSTMTCWAWPASKELIHQSVKPRIP